MSTLIEYWTQEPVTYVDWAPEMESGLSNRNRNAIKKANNILNDTFNKYGRITENDVRDAFGLPAVNEDERQRLFWEQALAHGHKNRRITENDICDAFGWPSVEDCEWEYEQLSFRSDPLRSAF